MIEISVIVVTFNHLKYIRQAMDSFVGQKTDFDYEILVHDDCSTDGTAEIVREYAEKYPEKVIPILQEENQYSKGLDVVREFVFPKCRGRYIAFCEGDDYWCDENKLQKQFDFLKSHPDYSACVHNTMFIDAFTQSETLRNACTTEKDIVMEDVIPAGSVEYHMSSLIYKREYMYRPDAFKAKGIGDYPRALYLCSVGKMHYLPDVMSVHRVNVEGSWTSKHVGSDDAEKQVAHYRKLNVMLEKVDDVTEKKYHDLIVKTIRWNECIILQWQDNAKKILKDYQDVYRSMSRSEKGKILIKAYFPHLFKALNRVRMNMRRRKI